MTHSHIQLGKNGVTKEFIIAVKSHFESHDNVKVSILRGATRDREQIKKIADELLSALGKNYTARILGFTIFLKRWRKAMRE